MGKKAVCSAELAKAPGASEDVMNGLLDNPKVMENAEKLMENPVFAQMANSMMENAMSEGGEGGLEEMLNTPGIEEALASGQMPDLSNLMNRPEMQTMVNNLMSDPSAMSTLMGMMGGEGMPNM